MAVRGVAFCLSDWCWAAACRLPRCSSRPRKPISSHATGSCSRTRLTAQAIIPEAYRRAIVTYHRKEAPGTIVIDSDARYLYYVLPEGKAIRYGVTVGEEALAWSGIAKIGRMEEWPSWTPTAEIKKRLDNIPNFVSGGPHNPMGARGIYLYANGKDTLFRIHGHQSAGIDRRCHLVGLHPDDQRGRDRSLHRASRWVRRWWCCSPSRATRRTIRRSRASVVCSITTEKTTGWLRRRRELRRRFYLHGSEMRAPSPGIRTLVKPHQ